MKKIFFIIAGCTYTFIANAQNAAFGIKGGLNVATVTVDNSASSIDPRISFHAGGLVHIHLSSQFALQPELTFSGQGYQTKINGNGNNQHINLNYLNLPILLQLMVGKGFRVETGPQFGALISAKHKAPSIDDDIKKNYKTTDFSWDLGVGYLDKSGFGIDARYNFGIAKINDNALPTNRNNVFQLGVFYQFTPTAHK